MTNITLKENTDAGNPHVRFDGGEVAPAKPRRGTLRYKKLGVCCAGILGSVLVFAAEPDSSTLTWKNETGGDVADVANWSGVPSGVTDISYDDSTMYYGRFYAMGSVNLKLTLSKDFTFNRYYLQSANTKYDLDLGGHTLKMRGYGTAQIAFNQNQHNQELTIRNGAFDFYSSARTQFQVFGSGNVLTFLGTESEPMSITGCDFEPLASLDGQIVFTNVVARHSKIKMNNPTGTIVLTGSGTEFWHHLNDYAGVGTEDGGGSTLRIENGAVYDVINTQGSLKADVLIGGGGAGGNTMIVSGAGTCLSCTNRVASDSGVASIVVGFNTNTNRLHVTDRATLNLNSKILIGNPISDTARGSAHNNFIRIDSNAVVTAADVIIGQRANRSNHTYSQPEAFFASNVCVIADGARVTLTQNGLKVGTEYEVSESAIVVTNKAHVTTRINHIGTAGVSNRLEVIDGGVVYGREAGLDWGLFAGGTASTGTVVSVDGGILALTNCLLKLAGSAEGSETRLVLRNGADVFAQHLWTTNAGNRIEIDDATLTVKTEGLLPCGGAGTVTLAFSGKCPKFYFKNEHVGGQSERLVFGSGASFSFAVPAGGYAEAPIQSAKGITIANLTGCAFDAKAFGRGGFEQVLMDAGTGTISIDAASLAVIREAAVRAKADVRLSEDKKRLTLAMRKGLMIVVK